MPALWKVILFVNADAFCTVRIAKCAVAVGGFPKIKYNTYMHIDA